MPEISTKLDDKLHWYKDAIIYELHIKAFRDGNCDGIGDFKGLMEKLDYLQDLGVTAIWLLPFYPSPLKDDGYDIADYYHINPSYGDIREFRQFLKEAHKRNLKVITELVINHTSDQHPWFQRARKAPKGSSHRNYYVWTDDPHQYKDARIIFQDFEASNWSWDPVAKQYYWHRFFFHQPDLNYDNPEVQEEVFKMINYWCKMGVDGFRLDAVPYLFERDGTNCENLPETHAFLKKLRKYVDDNFPGTLLLAEANMWPEDSAAYFGDGDECQMNYHFPVMPRMFMALQMEDRYPLTDIFDQTPQIPDTCQWAIFLRNHDELTLEMVTDEERDYMYKVYVKDPKARINLGIRHRLAPLMENDRKKIELLNSLLFTLPGTPVVYYGDEIGMGDNFYLGDRDGVRTPMQWGADRNAGFSQANPQRLYLPLILDPQFHYGSVNVEIQSRNTSSLLWWTKRIISMRKKYRAFSRGDMKFVDSENAKVLSFTRTYGDEIILVIANLSRFSQAVELDLDAYTGYVPVEIFSRNHFPIVKDANPYFVTLGAYSCQCFLLQKERPELLEQQTRHVLELERWKDLVEPSNLEQLENSILPTYLMKMRWFGGKSRGVERIAVTDHGIVPHEDMSIIFLLIEVSYQSGLPDTYQLPVAFGRGDFSYRVKETCPQSVISGISVAGEEGVLYDAIYGLDLQMAIIKRMATNHDAGLRTSEIDFSGNKLLRKYVQEHDKIKPRVLSAEQSNTSITYDNLFFLKIYRKVDLAINPDLEITHFLTKHARFKHIPAFVGAIEWKFSKGTMVLGMMQEMVKSNSDAWEYMLDRLNDFNDKILTHSDPSILTKDLKGSLLEPVVYEDVPENIKELLEGSVAEGCRLLGIRTGQMHLALASGKDLDAFKPEEYSLHYQRSVFSSLQTLVRATFQSLNRNLKKLPADVREEAVSLLGMKEQILTVLKRIYSRKIDVTKIRIHGDYHLGQVLYTGKDFIILDFEGEPARSYSERRLKYSPLRDVAGMIRSFHYAAYGSLFLDNQIRREDIAKLLPFVEQWYHYMSGFFMHAYLDEVRGSHFIPEDKDDLEILLQTFLLQKAIYELNYELNNRPNWVIVPLRGIKAILAFSKTAAVNK
ncbi:maltose alpha-D-glucosyltransferase/alpha-amylase [Arcticibacter tournemirensis]|uniref:Maltokinase n=1 Tax=Arcticibacter tournemirensis TaxID=699437 RepID=A0A4Q0M566_9SPHI|nr:maltose alpha-D-glucosyltransferase [Arcticibacter tournemirensis]KAA8485284.1 maltose alpha-D-glucosyltransferase [Arcticibacter tournemirensis]RXF68141.1 maltose alpha-D-glucosyltransferase [Arcticibacter tournemirensis]TQM50432.1 maltose alpha-D-glucosyltransferase/alpha-amylase [Arcticibacter tournemirensis]